MKFALLFARLVFDHLGLVGSFHGVHLFFLQLDLSLQIGIFIFQRLQLLRDVVVFHHEFLQLLRLRVAQHPMLPAAFGRRQRGGRVCAVHLELLHPRELCLETLQLLSQILIFLL